MISRDRLFFTRVGWRRATLRPALVLLAAAVAYAAAGFSIARGGTVAWALGGLAGVIAILGLSFAAVAVAERSWPFVPVLVASLVLLIAVPGALAQGYLGSHGERMSATVTERTCNRVKGGNSARCVYHYRLRRPDGSLIARPFSPPGGVDHQVGDTVEVVEDPRGFFGPRRVDGVDGTDVGVSAWSAGIIVALLAIAAATGETRRRGMTHPRTARDDRKRS